MKKIKRLLAFAMIMILVLLNLGTNVAVNAEENSENYKVEIINVSENSYVKIKRSTDSVISEYYENGNLLQRSICSVPTGEILYFDYGKRIKKENSCWNASNEVVMQRYHIDDFRVKEEKRVDEVSVYAINSSLTDQNMVDGGAFTEYPLKTKFFTAYGKYYARYLYGYTFYKDWVDYSQSFAAGTSLAIITGVLGKLFPQLAWPLVGISTVGGIIINEVTVQRTIRDHYWKYTMREISPERYEFTTIDNFLYKQEVLIKITGEGEAIYETIYEQSEGEIDAIREDILENPKEYW